MFDLEEHIITTLKSFQKKTLISRSRLDEIESHLRDEIDHLVECGASVEEAFKKAMTNLGNPDFILEEYSKLYGSSQSAKLRNVLSYYFNKEVVMRLFLGFGIGVFFILAGLLLEGGHISSMLQLTGFLIVVGGAFGALLIAYPAKVVLRSFILGITGKNSSIKDYNNAARVFKSFGDLSVFSGAIGVILGIIHVCENLQYPDSIGPGLAVAFTAILYSMFIKLFLGKPMYDAFVSRANPNDTLHIEKEAA